MTTAAADVPPVSDLTVVIITRDRGEELCATLGHLAALPERPPVIVVDNGSGDDTVRMVDHRFPEVRVVALGSNQGGSGRNVGVSLAATTLVAFCDDDTWWSPGSLAAAADLFAAHPRLAVATARILVEPEGETDAMSLEMGESPLPRPTDAPGAPLLSFLAGASVVRRRAFLGCGGFSGELLIGGEEELLGCDLADAGWAMAYVPELEIHHRASVLRDAHLRRRQGIRNTLWCTWLRRPLPSAWRRTRSLLRSFPRDAVSAAALVDAVGGVSWILSARRPVGQDVEAGLTALEAGQARSEARRYVS